MIAALIGLGIAALANGAYQKWRKWPAPEDWTSPYGRIDRED